MKNKNTKISQELNALDNIDAALLDELTAKYDVTEINVIDENVISIVTPYPDFLNYDMRNGSQSAEFMVLLESMTEYVQSYQPVPFTNPANPPAQASNRVSSCRRA